MNTVLITGATGNIGRHLVAQLTGHPGLSILPCYRKPRDAAAFRDQGHTPVQLNMDSAESARQAVQGVETLFLLKPYTIRMLIQSKVMLDAALAAGVRHVIHLGAHGADDTPFATIGWNHMVERYVEALGFSWTHLRPNFFMDNLLRTAKPETGVVTHFLGERPISWISCHDIAAVAAAVISNPTAHTGKTYPLATDKLSMPALASLLTEITGIPYRYQRLSSETGFDMMTGLGREPEFVRPWLDYMAAVADGAVEDSDVLIENVEALTGEAPLLLRDFIRLHKARFS